MSESFKGPSIEKSFRLCTGTARHIWRLQAEQMDVGLNKIQDRLALNCTDKELEMLEKGICRIIDEACEKIEEVILTGERQAAKLKGAGTPVSYRGVEDLVCSCHSPAMVRYVEALVRLDALLMLIDGLWLRGIYSTADRTALMHRWRSHFLKMHRDCDLLLNRGWASVQRRKKAASEGNDAVPKPTGSKKSFSRGSNISENKLSLRVVNNNLPTKEENRSDSVVEAESGAV